MLHYKYKNFALRCLISNKKREICAVSCAFLKYKEAHILRAMKKKVVLAYSGGLDTSVMVKWLQEKGYDVVTFTGDLGQQIDLDAAEKKAKKTGAVSTYTEDMQKEFVEEYVWKALKANSLYEGSYPNSTTVGRPLLVKKLVEIAKKEGAAAIAHGCTGKGNDQVRFDVYTKSLAPDFEIIAPVREWNMNRTEEIEYAKKHGIEIPEIIGKYSTDQNLWGRSIECGPLEDPNHEPDDDVFELITKPEDAPDKPEYVKIQFEKGVPVALNGKKLGGVEIIEKLNELGGKHGVGIIDHMESRLVGIKSRETYECPAAVILIAAHKDLEKIIFTRHLVSFKNGIDWKWSEMAYTALWFDPLFDALNAFIDETQQYVNGEVTVKLYKGSCMAVGRTSPNSIYEYDLATYEEQGTFDQTDAEPFIKLWGLQSVLFKKKNG